MLLNNLSIYNNILKRSKEDVIQRDDKRYEVERLYSTSPIIFDYSETYLPEGTYMMEDEGSQRTGEAGESQRSKSSGYEEASRVVAKDTVLTFSPTPVVKSSDEKTGYLSALTRLIEEARAKEDAAGEIENEGGTPLTIYLPDCSSITVNVKETSNFKEVILQTLKSHEKQGVQPPLIYDDPGMYELRIHEGDGEPDRDFPPLDPTKLLSDFNLDEYCLCVVEGRRRAGTGPPTSSTATGGTGGSGGTGGTGGTGGSGGVRGTANTTSDTFSSLGQLRSNGSGGGGGGGLRHCSSAGQLSAFTAQSNLGHSSSNSGRVSAAGARDDTDLYALRRDRDRDQVRNRNRSASRQTDDSFENSVNTVLIVFPDATQVVVPFREDTKLLDLLPRINKTKRLRLYTNEYVFAVSTADQKRLKLMSPYLDMQRLVSTLGACTTLEIHNKQYQDVARVEKTTTTKKKRPNRKSTKSNFTEAMANAYQEWNVVKKNKFGRKQERVFGVDGRKIYNSKRGALRGGNQSGVQRAERNISTIVKLEILPADPRTFRITWMDDRDVYNIEYTCETARECAEIVAKINYTREKYK